MRAFLALLLLAVAAVAEQSVTLTWDPANQVDSYRLYEKTVEGWNRVASFPGTQIRHTLDNYDAKTARTFALVAVNSAGLESERSNELLIPAAPQAPSGLKVEVVVNVSINN